MDNQNNGFNQNQNYGFNQNQNYDVNQNYGFNQSNPVYQTPQSNPNVEVGKGLKIGSLVAGIVSIVVPPISFISSIVGIVLGSKYKKLTGQGCAGKAVSIGGLVMSFIYAIIFALIVLIFIGAASGADGFSFETDFSGPSFEYSYGYDEDDDFEYDEDDDYYFEDEEEDDFDAEAFEDSLTQALVKGIYGGIKQEYICGKWNLCNFDGGGSSEEVIVNFILNEDGTFEWKYAEDPYDNYVKGTYTFKDLNKINNGENARYVEIELNGEEFVIDGVVQEDIYKSKYEMALVTENEDGVINSKYDIYSILLINSDTYNMYYAER